MRRYAVSLVLLLALVSLWELATPLLAAPDEPQHLLKAAAVARGEWIGREDPDGPLTHVWLPDGFRRVSGYPHCFAFRPRRTAACAPPINADGGPPVLLETTAGRYPPAYYGVVGLPTLLVRGIASDRAARVLSGLLCAVLLAAAMAWAAGDLLALAVPVAVTPMVLFLSSVVNPSGLEIAAAAASWVGLLRLARGSGPARPAALVAVLCTLALARPISVMWLLLLLLVTAATSTRERLRELAAQRAVQVGAVVVGLACAAQVAWVVLADSTRLFGKPMHVSRVEAVGKVLTPTHVGHLAMQVVGRFGWLDTRVPLLSLRLWAFAAAVLLAIGLLRGSRQLRVVLVVAVAAAVLVPALVEASSLPRLGYWWQGRYSLPFLIGLPFLALVGRSLRRRWLIPVAALLAVAQVDAFVLTLARYTVGAGHGYGLGAVTWHPPLAPVTLTVLFAVTVVAWTAWAAWLAQPRKAVVTA